MNNPKCPRETGDRAFIGVVVHRRCRRLAAPTAFSKRKPRRSPTRNLFFAPVPKAVCGPGDKPETALQGQVPAAMRAAGFQGFSCNLQLIGQVKGEGANWQTAEWREGKGKTKKVCAYHGTAAPDRESDIAANESRCAGHRHHRSDQAGQHRVSHHHLDARSVGVAQDQRTSPVAWRRQRTERRRRSGDRHLRRVGRLPVPAIAGVDRAQSNPTERRSSATKEAGRRMG